MLKRGFYILLLASVLVAPLSTHAGFWSTITGWFSNDDTVYVAPSEPAQPSPQPEVLPEQVSTPEPTLPQQPSVPTYTPPVTTTPSPVSFIGGVTLQQLNDALKKLEDRLEPQIERAMDSPRSRGEVSNQSSHALPEGTDGYILQSDGDDDVIWVSPASLTVTGDGTFSTTSADYWKSVTDFFSTTSADHWFTQQSIPGDGTFSTTSADVYVAASSTIAHAGNASTGMVLYWNGSGWVATATSSLGLASGVYSGAYVYNSTNGSANNGWILQSFNTEYRDTDSYHDTSSNNSRVVVPSSGVYSVSGQCRMGTTGTIGVEVGVNCGGVYNGCSLLTQAFTAQSVSGPPVSAFTQADVTLAAGDYVEVFCYVSSGTQAMLAGFGSTYLQVSKVGI